MVQLVCLAALVYGQVHQTQPNLKGFNFYQCVHVREVWRWYHFSFYDI